jgi:hypothetical protein
MDEFAIKMMEKVFKKTEKYPIDNETRIMIENIRKKVNISPRHSKESSNVEEYFKNTEERLISELDNDPNEELLNAYLKMKENKLEIKSIYDMNE